MNVRAAIIAAAEALYRRGGTDAVTLSAVAREVNFARSVIYAHFASRQELIAMVAPPDAVPPIALPSAAPALEAVPSVQLVTDAVPPEEPVLEIVPSAEPLPDDALSAEVQPEAAPADEPQPPKEAESYDALMRAQAEALQEITKQVIVPKPRTATDAALARLDARLSVAEKSLQSLEQRMGERLKSVDVDTGALAERLHGLRQRLEKFEERQTSALAQIRLDVHNLRSGAPLLEPVRMEALVPEPQPYEPEVVAPEASDIAPAVEAEPAVTEPTVRVADYLVSARRAANDAAVRRANHPAKHKPAWLRFLGKRRWAILAAVAALVAWFDIYVFAQYQPAQGADVPVAVTKLTPPPVTAKPEWSPRAQLVRGLKYLNGTGVPVDLDKARLWIGRAALRGQPVAQNLMGVIYQTGTGVGANMPVAIGWYEGAAKAGNLKAMTNLGKLYAGGWREGTDFAKAAEWFAKAAAFGEVDAAFDLAILYERGEGVVRNRPQAYKWYAVAARLGDRNAAARAQTLAVELTPEEREAADAAAMAFRPAAVDAAANDTPATKG
jgi:TPR repeat protein